MVSMLYVSAARHRRVPNPTSITKALVVKPWLCPSFLVSIRSGDSVHLTS